MAGPSSLKARKPSKVVKPKKSKLRSTATTKHHRFQSFSERITKLKIDPVRRRRHAENHDELTDDTASYFGRSLQEWKDLNLSAAFTAFAREVAPFSDNLAMILHHDQKIMQLLVTYIQRGDSLAMEPLLSLLAHFAHDLDARFEQHFQAAISTVAAVASKHTDPAVIEWSFTCLAWLFKYLSRLLVPDLRPLYDLMSPYLGREPQKPFIIRFAAESFSFLLRKAAASYERDSKPLDRIVVHILQDYSTTQYERSAELHRQGIMTLLTESVKSVQSGLHSNGLAILACLLSTCHATSALSKAVVTDLMTGVLTSLIHHTDSESFQPALQLVTAHIQSQTPEDEASLLFASDILFATVAVRKGTRIVDWSLVSATVRELFERAENFPSTGRNVRAKLLALLSIVLMTATMHAVLPLLPLLETAQKDRWTELFPRFCDMCTRLNRDRFQHFVLPALCKYMATEWQCHTDELLLLLPTFPAGLSADKPLVPMEMQVALTERVEHTASKEWDMINLPTTNAALQALKLTKLREDNEQKVASALVRMLQCAVTDAANAPPEWSGFALGVALDFLLDCRIDSYVLSSLWSSLCEASAHLWSLPAYWKSMLRFAKQLKPTLHDDDHVQVLKESLTNALQLPSHDVRQYSLELAGALYDLEGCPVPDVLSTAIAIESTPISLDTSRGISLNIRLLASGLHAVSPGAWIAKAIVTYCFGLLHVRLAQAWEDAIKTLLEICKVHSTCEGTVMALAQTWLEMPSTPCDEQLANTRVLHADSDGFQVVSDFECSNLARMSAVTQQVFEASHAGYLSPQHQLCLLTKRASLATPDSRSQALRVLQAMPYLAEKRSRALVPVLLSWAAGHSAGETSERWNRKDQKALLAVFAQFTNPKALYRAPEVHQALLQLCANGDVEIQRSALKAILTWKDTAVARYEEHLTNLLDDARFREEMATFLQGANEEGAISAEDYERLTPVLLRLLYGRAVAGGKHGQESRRKAVFSAISRFGHTSLELFVDIAITPVTTPGTTFPQAPLRQQLGMLNMLSDLLETIGAGIISLAAKILNAVVPSTVNASKELDVQLTDNEREDVSLLRAVRQSGIHCLVQLYGYMPELAVNCSEAAAIILDELVAPRLPKFATENSQSVSGLLRLFSAWAASPQSAQLLAGPNLLARLAELLREPAVKTEVCVFVLRDIVGHLLQDTVEPSILAPHVSDLVKSIGVVLGSALERDLLDASVAVLIRLADRINDKGQAQEVIDVCCALLTKTTKLVSPGIKAGLLRTLMPLLESSNNTPDIKLFAAVSGLLSRFSDAASRSLVLEVLSKLCLVDPKLQMSTEICADLNAQSVRLDNADYERRERGFTNVLKNWQSLTPHQWLPVVHTCLFYIRDAEDLVNRASAAQALTLFVDAAAASKAGETQAFHALAQDPLVRGIQFGMQQQSEVVRAEYVRLLGHVTAKLPNLPAVSDLAHLVPDGDGEASFFSGVLHIQHHPRLLALDRLASAAPHISSSNTTKLFLPLLEHFIFDQAEGDRARNLADRTITTIRALAASLTWPVYRSTFKRYISYVSSKEGLEKTVLRLLGALVDALASKPPQAANSDENIASGKAQTVMRDFLPPLQQYLHRKDESTVDRRMPVAVTIVKLLLLLPEDEMASRLPAILTDVAHVLRSRRQEARDETRKTLASILALIGPQYLGFMLKELSSALRSGYQLHVLSYTVHSLLISLTATDNCMPGDLDHCLPDLMAIIMDDIFGITGQEKDAEEYKSGMKEVKSSKSYDTMELLAKLTQLNKLGVLVQPLRALLAEKLDSRMSKKVDELLNRLRKGVDQNPAASSRDLLVFCHEIVRLVYAEQNRPVIDQVMPAYKVRKYLVQAESARKSGGRGATTSQMYKLVSFALNLVRKVVRRHEDLLTPVNMAGFLSMAGDALVQGEEEVRLAAMRLLATVIKVPLARIDGDALVYVKEAVAIIKGASDIHSDFAKAAVELVTAVLRERRSVTVKDTDVAVILKALKADIDEPDQQGTIYKFLRAVVGRKIIITEMYELMDEVGKVMVTNPDRSIRESARSAYLQFVMEYPQGKDRWKKQTAFLIENLRYQHATGRQSLLELLHQLLAKLSDERLEPLAMTLFVSLIPVRVSDGDVACQQMAGLLIAKLFERAEKESLESFSSLMTKWLDNDEKPMLAVAALQCWQTYLQARRDVSTAQLEQLRDRLAGFLKSEDIEVGPQLLQAVLDTVSTLADSASSTIFAAKSTTIWESITGQWLEVSQTDIQQQASKLLEIYFAHFARSNKDAGLSSIPLKGSYGLSLDEDGLCSICRTLLQVLHGSEADSLLESVTRNLAFVGRVLSASGLTWKDNGAADGDSGAPSALSYLLRQLSFIVRQDLPAKNRIAATQCLVLIIKHLDEISDVQTLLRPLYTLTDTSVSYAQDQAHVDLIDKARELLDLVQSKVGSEKYISALGETRNEATARRDERRQKRKLEAVSAPERWAREKKRKHDAQKARKKVKGAEMAGRRRGW
ncbi:hypothetical protein BAUCODRAFT_34636 [Baudoinia panamericana UAMH 10762]|uniref:Uncharacterized protein n=1 Tax=Baudoinia panamericana (strain UAMH 10762) TaxID=717646 RepID=M2N9R6_BAUPA|nr:uncharacterized protein BAUCODRAFT_34636 [Baudoinia panamericana UAMH 10762]EMC95869.1 hypothetical protein BAUCODRAFT_34636 [Baudoinia panamericana UAMH 10762]